MQSPVNDIKNRLPIEDVVGSYIELTPAGKNHKALCPFHHEKTPSFTVSPDRGTFYCFGCQESGDIFSFVEKFEGVDFKGALKILADRAGVKLSGFDPKQASERDRLFDILEAATALYEKNLAGSESAEAYLTDRGVKKKTLSDFRIGFAPDSWSFIQGELTKKGFKESEIEKAGLIVPRKSGSGYYDRFRNRIMFPLMNSGGQTIAFSGRTLETDPETAKYINSPETLVFKKRAALFGIDKAKPAIRKLNFSILVEGQMDLVLSHQAGFRNSIASSGTALGASREGEEEGNLDLVRRLSKNMVLAFDSDSAGEKAALVHAGGALQSGMDVKIAILPAGKDPADVIKKDPKEWKAIIRGARDVVEHALENILKQNEEKAGGDRKRALKQIRKDIFPLINSVPLPADRDHYITLVADRISLSKEALLDETRGAAAASFEKKGERGEKREEKETDSRFPPEIVLAGLYRLVSDRNIDGSKELLTSIEATLGDKNSEAIDKLDEKRREALLFSLEQLLDRAKSLTQLKTLVTNARVAYLEHIADGLRRALEESEEQGSKKSDEYLRIRREIDTLKRT